MKVRRAKRWIAAGIIVAVVITGLVVFNFVEYTPRGFVGYYNVETVQMNGMIPDNGNHFSKSGLLSGQFYFREMPGKHEVLSYSLLNVSRHRLLVARTLIASHYGDMTWTWLSFPLALSGERNLDLSSGKYVLTLYVNDSQAATTTFYVDRPIVAYLH